MFALATLIIGAIISVGYSIAEIDQTLIKSKVIKEAKEEYAKMNNISENEIPKEIIEDLNNYYDQNKNKFDSDSLQWEMIDGAQTKKNDIATFRNRETGEEIIINKSDGYHIFKGAGTKKDFKKSMLLMLETGMVTGGTDKVRQDVERLYKEISKMQTEDQIEKGYFIYNEGKNHDIYIKTLDDSFDSDKLSDQEYLDFYGEERKEKNTELSPYVRYMERMQQEQEQAELGLLQEQTRAAQQGADIAAQQAMMQQGQFRDQIIEQIKSDRLGKMRQGISPMQIANEELQMMVGGSQQNAQMMSQVNQQQLSAYQQERMNPYQAYINSQQAVTGGQGYANMAAGFDATRASSMPNVIKDLMNLGYNQAEAANIAQGKFPKEKPPIK